MIQNCNNYKVLKVFLDNSLTGFKLREISRKINLGLPSVSNYIKQLKKEDLIKEKKVYGLKLWFANREYELFKKYKVADSILSLEKNKILDFLDKEHNYPTIILFGSASIGEDVGESDFDLCIITENKKEKDLRKFEKLLGRKIQVFLFSESEFANLKFKNPELVNNIINGIVLRGVMRIK